MSMLLPRELLPNWLKISPSLNQSWRTPKSNKNNTIQPIKLELNKGNHILNEHRSQEINIITNAFNLLNESVESVRRVEALNNQ